MPTLVAGMRAGKHPEAGIDGIPAGQHAHGKRGHGTQVEGTETMTTKTEPIFRPMLLAILLAGGAAFVWAFFIIQIHTSIPTGPAEDPIRRQVLVLNDGTPVIQSEPYSASDSRDRKSHDLDGVLLDDHRGLDYSLHGDLLAGPKQVREPLDGIDWSHRLVSFYDKRRPRSFHWYFMHDGQTDGRGYFVGYEEKSKLLVGHIGRKGFQENRPTSEDCFRVDARKMYCRAAIPRSRVYGAAPNTTGGYSHWPGDRSLIRWNLRHTACLLTDEGIVAIDLRSREVEIVYESTEVVSIGVTAKLEDLPDQPKIDSPGYFPYKRHDFLLARMPDRVLAFDPRGRETFSCPIPDELADVSFNCLLLTGSTGATMVLRDTRLAEQGGTIDRLIWMDAKGQVVRREEVSLVGPPREFEALMTSLIFPSPAILVCGVLGVLLLAELESPTEYDFNAAGLASLFAEYWPTVLILLLMSLAAAYVCFRRQRRYALAGTRAWVAMVFLFGIPGLLGYLFCRRWPVLAACPACHAPAPRDRQCCSACDTPFPEPELKGIEVFA